MTFAKAAAGPVEDLAGEVGVGSCSTGDPRSDPWGENSGSRD